MKKSKRTKRQNNSPTNSNRKFFEPSSVRGLVTSREERMMESSSQIQNTQRTNNSRTTAFSQDFDDDEVMQKEGMNEVFVNEEEQKAIYKILQVARKGKINQKNAFEIPLKVMENDNYSGQGKFWKFASELLGVSMNIYEKRIQNTWVSTNVIHDKLARMTYGKQQKEQNNQNEENVNRPARPQFHMISVQDFRDQKNMQNVQVGEETLEDINKISISILKSQLTNDPLFQKKLKAFDNTSVKGLLLNIFDLSSTCEVELFSTQNRMKIKQPFENSQNVKISQSMAKQVQESMETLKSHPFFFANITQFKRQNTIKQNEELNKFDSIGFIRYQKTNSEEPLFEDLEAFIQQPFGELQSQMKIFDGQFEESSGNFKSHFEDPETFSGDVDNEHSFSKPSFFSHRQRLNPMMFGSDQFSFDSDAALSFHSVTTPWQMQFRQGKLKKKVTKRGPKGQIKKKQTIQPQEIQFHALKIENKKQILKISKESKAGTKRKKNFQNLIPPQLAVYEKINFKKTSQTFETIKQQMSQPIGLDIPDFLAPDPSMIEPISEKQDREENFNSIPEQLLQMGQSQVRRSGNYTPPDRNPQKYTNIRQTKKLIFEKTKATRELRLSQIDEQYLTSANALITFLHIANEKNMSVRSTGNEDDVILSWE